MRSVVRFFRSFACRARVGFESSGSGFLFGSNVSIGGKVFFGKNVYIGTGSIIYPNVIIGDYSMLGPSVYIMGEDHVINKVGVPIVFSGRPNLPVTKIGRDVWLGARVFVKCGVSIGDGSIVGAGSIVLKDVPSNSIAVGCPARVIKSRLSPDDFLLHMEKISSGSFKKEYAHKMA